MMSKASYLTDIGAHNGSHLMSYETDESDTAWGANLTNSPLLSVNYGHFSPAAYPQLKTLPPLSVLLVGVDKWSPPLDRSLYDAPRRADSMQAFPSEFNVAAPDKIRFFVALSPIQSVAGRAMEFFTVRMPAWRPGSQPAVDPHGDWRPVFPVTGLQAAVGDSVTLEFVVDEHGAPIQTTLRLLSGQFRDYARLVVDAAFKSRYIPAMAAGCPVKGLFHRAWQMSVTRKYE